MSKRILILLAAVILTVVWATDALIASATSPTVTKRLREALDANPGMRVTFFKASVHPIFMRLDLEHVDVFDPDRSGARVLYASRVHAKPDIGSWFSGRRDFSELVLEGASVNIVKDRQGTFNVERIAHPEKSSGGWKHQDWMFNLYERLKRSARGAAVADQKGSLFSIGQLRLRGRAVLTDHRMKPIVLRDFEARVYGLRWTKTGTVELDTLDVRGTFQSARKGRFDVGVTRGAGELHATIDLKNFDLTPLLPLYRSTSPVFFDRGFVTLHSDTRLAAEKIDSRNHLRIDDYAMRPAVSWSPESSTVLRALNRHRALDIRFAVTGHPDHPSFEGFVDSLLKMLEKDFDKHTLTLIRARAQQEMAKAENSLSR